MNHVPLCSAVSLPERQFIMIPACREMPNRVSIAKGSSVEYLQSMYAPKIWREYD